MKKTQRIVATLVAAALLLFLSIFPSSHASPIQAEGPPDNPPPTNASIPKAEDGVKTPEAQGRLFPVQVNGKWGYIDRSGTLIVPPQFEAAEPFAEGLGVVKRLGRYGAVQSDGTMAIQPIFSKLHPPSEGLLAYQESGRWGFLSSSGRKVIETRFEEVRPIHEGLARVKSGGKYGFIDRHGNLVIPPRFPIVDDFSNGRAWISDDGKKRGYIDNTGSVAIPVRYSFSEKFSEGLAVVVAEHELSVLSIDGRQAFHIGAFSRLNMLVMSGVFLGDMVFSEGLLPCPRGDRWGYVDSKGKEQIPSRYLSARPFSEGLAAVGVLEAGTEKIRVGFIDHSGAWMIEPRFDMAEDFSGGLARVKVDDGGYAYVDRHGNWVWKPWE